MLTPEYTPDTADYYAAWEESLDRFAPEWREHEDMQDMPEPTDETLAIMSEDMDAQRIAARLNDGQTYTNHPSHSFTGFDGRCMFCDCRPYGRHAPYPCN